jgi:hypothetical protein
MPVPQPFLSCHGQQDWQRQPQKIDFEPVLSQVQPSCLSAAASLQAMQQAQQVLRMQRLPTVYRPFWHLLPFVVG